MMETEINGDETNEIEKLDEIIPAENMEVEEVVNSDCDQQGSIDEEGVETHDVTSSSDCPQDLPLDVVIDETRTDQIIINDSTDESEIKCTNCDIDFKRISNLKRHKCHLSCKDCDKTFCTKRQLKVHVRNIHKNNNKPTNKKKIRETMTSSSFPCTRCDKVFAYEKSLNSHSRLHDGRAFSCNDCDKKFSKRMDLREHVIIHVTGDVRPFKCIGCPQDFALKKNLISHLKQVHTITDKMPVFCSFCAGAFINERYLREHEFKVHSSVTSSEAGRDDVFDDDAKKEFSCTVCLKKFLHENSMKKHVKLFHNNIKGKEDEEGENGSEVQNEQIKGSSPPKKHHCETCNRDFKRISSLKHHRCNQICEICGKTLSSRSSLTSHLQSHSGIKSHLCSFCPKAFATNKSLRDHEMVHEGNQPFKCGTCSKKFSRKKDFRNHELVHERHAQKKKNDDDGIKNKDSKNVQHEFQCPKCPKSFAYEKSLKAHLRLHSGAFSCSVCAKYFVKRTDLQEHELAHELGDDRPFPCNLTGCDKKFKHKKNLNAHLKTCHNPTSKEDAGPPVLKKQSRSKEKKEPIIGHNVMSCTCLFCCMGNYTSCLHKTADSGARSLNAIPRDFTGNNNIPLTKDASRKKSWMEKLQLRKSCNNNFNELQNAPNSTKSQSQQLLLPMQRDTGNNYIPQLMTQNPIAAPTATTCPIDLPCSSSSLKFSDWGLHGFFN